MDVTNFEEVFLFLKKIPSQALDLLLRGSDSESRLRREEQLRRDGLGAYTTQVIGTRTCRKQLRL